MSQRHADLVVLGLEFEYFARHDLLEDNKPGTEFESHLAVSSDGRPNGNRTWRRVSDILQVTMSSEALSDSAATLAANLSGESSHVVAGNWISEPYRYASAIMGSYSIFLQWNFDGMRVD